MTAQSTNQIMDIYIGEIVGGMIRDAATWKAQALALQAENAMLKAEIAALKAAKVSGRDANIARHEPR